MSVNNLKSQKRGGFYWKEEKPYVSVTEILKVINKPALMYWHGEQIYWAMVKDPTLPKEIAMRAPYEVSDKAKSRGTTVHSIVEAYKYTGGEIEVAEEFKGYQDAFSKFRERKIKELQLQKASRKPCSERTPEFKAALRVKFVEQLKKYIGVPYAERYKAPEEPVAPLYLDCCALVRKALQDLQEDFGFVTAKWNQAYQLDTCPIEVEFENLEQNS